MKNMSGGLNETQRGIIRNLVANGYNGEYVREQMRDMAKENSGTNNWDYNKNSNFCGELAARDYFETARYLENLINNKVSGV
jgi:hypothetical protein